MLLNKRNLAVVGAASKEESRYTLQAILMEADGSTVATNGHILARCSPATARAADFPANGNGNLAGWAGRVLLPIELVARAGKLLPKKNRLPILDNVAVGLVEEMLVAEADIPKQEARGVPESGQFPNYEAAIPRDIAKPLAEVILDVDKLMRLLKIAREFDCGGGDHAVRIRLYGPERAVRLDAVNREDGQEFCGVIMPRRAEIAPRYKTGEMEARA
jgi:DNA polymerase III sliding clamp (beta) subunit (PCNA family)